MTMPQISQARLLNQALLDANMKYLELEIRLGIREAKELGADEENILDKLRREQEERERKKEEKQREKDEKVLREAVKP